MDFTIVLALLAFLECTKSSSTKESFTTKLNKVSVNKGFALYVNITNVMRITNVLPKRNTQNKKTSSTSSTNSRLIPNKKWKIGRVTNKQYGIINVLWQKTKVFMDEDYSNLTCKATTIEMTPNIQKQKGFEKNTSKSSTVQGKLKTSTTPSYIEFYYFDQSDDRIKRKHPSNSKLQKLKRCNKTNVDRSNSKKSSIPSLFKIHINTVQRKHAPQPTKLVNTIGQGNFYQNSRNKSKRTTLVSKARLTIASKAIRHSKQPKKNRSQQTIHILTKSTLVNAKTKRNERKGYTTKKKSHTTKFVIGMTFTMNSVLVPDSTSIAYDKVKFFEMYDNNTPKGQHYITSNVSNNMTNNNKEKNYRDNEQILLHHVNQNIGHQHDKNKTRFVKKHIQDLYNKVGKLTNVTEIPKYFNEHDLKFSLTTSLQDSIKKNYSWSRPTVWTKFPFVAVYIYEPSQVHCDAAGISPHWLLAAASCLSRHRKGLRSGGLSAFVSFCGDNWRYPQMISYVKRTLIHPLYHPNDRLRRLFNAGLVQVVNSMAESCSGWAPASLMSHQYSADKQGSIGTAVGWGLDRYDESYSTTRIPRHPLMIYENRVYSQTCPGSSEYSQAESSDEVDFRNVYCLLLPPYLAEENDTVHGALLLIGGKLLALYLKEERRPWGVQSAQYASIWRLLPWLAETAWEPDESFHFEI